MTQISVYHSHGTALLCVSILFLSADWSRARKVGKLSYGLDNSEDVNFDFPQGNFAESPFSEAGDLYSIPRQPSNRPPYGIGGNRVQFGGGGGRVNRPWELNQQNDNMMMGEPRFMNTVRRQPALRSFPSRYGYPPRPIMSSFPDPAMYPVDRNLRGIDDFGPDLYRQSRRIGVGRSDPLLREQYQTGDPGGLDMSSYARGMNYANGIPMLELPGYDNLLSRDNALLQNRDRRSGGLVDDMGGGYYADMDPSYEASNTNSYANPNPYSYGEGRRPEKKRHHSHRPKYDDQEEVYTGSGKSYGPYGYQDSDFDESLIEELQLEDQQPEGMSTVDATSSGSAAGYSENGNNERLLNEEVANNFPSLSPPASASKGDGRKNDRTTRKPQIQASTDDLLEDVGFGNMRREAGETPQDVIDEVKNGNQAKDTSSGFTNMNPSEDISETRPSYQNWDRSRGGTTRTSTRHNNNNQFDRNRVAPQQSLPGGGRRPIGGSGQDALIRESFQIPGQMAGGRNFYQGIGEGMMDQPNDLGGMYGGMYGRMPELNRRRRNALDTDYYSDSEAYPILTPLPVPIVYESEPYNYGLPNLVFNRRKRLGDPVQLLINQRQQGEPRRVIRRVIRRRPFRRLRQQINRNQNEVTSGEEVNENAIEVDEITSPTIPKTDDSINNLNTNETVTTSTTTLKPSTEATKVPPVNEAKPKSDAVETKPIKSEHKRKRETVARN